MTRADLVLRDAVVHLPGGERVHGWISVIGGRIDAAGTGSPPSAATEYACEGAWALPGLVDIHVHFRDPGFTHKEDFGTGSAAAAAGGVTTVVDMPNTGNLIISPEDVREKLSLIAGRSHVDFGLYALLVDSAPHVRELAELGVAGLKWLLGYESLHGRQSQPSNRLALRDALHRAADAGLMVGVHAEDASWVRELADELREHGRHDVTAHGESRPPFVEGLAAAEAVVLAAEAGVRLHVHHLSSAFGLRVVDALRGALGSGVSVETCPHYLLLTADALPSLGTRARVNPPLRGVDDAAILFRALVEGTIDCVASDHAPHAPEEKVADSIWDVQSGLIGVETMFPLLFDAVHDGRLPPARLVEVTAQRPAEIVGLGHRKGKLAPGADADILLVDPDATSVVSRGTLHSKHPDSVFEGMRCRGRLRSVFLRGEEIVHGGAVTKTHRGEYVPSRAAA